MAQTTTMRYAVYDPDGCIESLLYSEKSARKMAQEQKKTALNRNRPVSVWRYDRSDASNYKECIATY